MKNIIRTLFSTVCCLVPFGAFAVDAATPKSFDDDTEHFSQGTYTGDLTGNDGAENPIYWLVNGESSTSLTGGLTVTGTTTLNGIGVGGNGTSSGWLYVQDGAASQSFTLTAEGDVSLGAINVASGWDLHLVGQGTTLPDITITTANDGLGTITANGNLSITKFNNITVAGATNVSDDLEMSATNDITMAALTATGDNVDITAGGTFSADAVSFQGTGSDDVVPSYSVKAGTITVDSIENSSSGSVTIESGDDLTVSGSIQNSGTGENANMTIDADGDISAATLTSTSGLLTVTGGSLTLSGMDSTNASLVLGSSAEFDITGETSLAYGWTLDNQEEGDSLSFSLTTGTLKFGDGVDGDKLTDMFTNSWDNFYLEITGLSNGFGLNIGNAAITNTNGNMKIVAQNITAGDIVSKADGGTLELLATGNDTDNFITVGDISGAVNTSTIISTSGTLTADSVTNNAGTVTDSENGDRPGMVLGGSTIVVNGSVVNNLGGDLMISGYRDSYVTGNPAYGTVTINGNVINSGTMGIYAGELTINGTLKNASGTGTIYGNASDDGITVGDILVAGGQLNINSVGGEIHVKSGLNVTNPDTGASGNSTGTLVVDGGALNFGTGTTTVTTDGDVSITGNVTVGDTSATAAGNVNIAGTSFTMTSTGAINIDGSVSTTDSAARHASFVSNNITVGGSITTGGQGWLTFGSTAAGSTLTAESLVANGGTIEINSKDTTVDSVLVDDGGGLWLHGESLTATNGGIDISGGLSFNSGSSSMPTSGARIDGTNEFSLISTDSDTDSDSDIEISGGMSVDANSVLNIKSAKNTTVSGDITNNGTLNVTSAAGTKLAQGAEITNGGTLTVTGTAITTGDLTNTGTATIGVLGTTDTLTMGDVTNSNTLTLNADSDITMGQLAVNGGTVSATAAKITADSMNLTAGKTTLNSGNINVTQSVLVGGDIVQGTTGNGMLNLTQSGTFTAGALTTFGGGNFRATGGDVDYMITNNVTIAGNMIISDGAKTDITSQKGGIFINSANTTSGVQGLTVNNGGTLSLTAANGITVANSILNNGSLSMNSGNGQITALNFTNTGTATLAGAGFVATGGGVSNFFNTSGILYQDFGGTLTSGAVNIAESSYAITASNITVGGISQMATNDRLTLNTSDLTVNGDIDAKNLTIAALGKLQSPTNNWLHVFVDGNVSGGVGFIGLQDMTITGNYTFDNNSKLHTAILPTSNNSRNYWATVHTTKDADYGKITNNAGENAKALITVKGQLFTDLNFSPWTTPLPADGIALTNKQVGIDIFSIVDQGSAIWLIHAENQNGGNGNPIEEMGDKIRNLYVRFCNADGSICYNYFDSFKAIIDEETGAYKDLPAYLSVRDTDGDGIADSIYIVFDPDFGGPVEVFKIQPVVERVPGHTDGEYWAAGALDDLIEGKLLETGFFNRTPIEVIPIIFRGTNMARLMQELYNRMEYYALEYDGKPLARFSRLVQPREVEQLTADIILNEHTTFRDFEDHMFDEFIWNRNRKLRKAWLDADYGFVRQKADDNKRISSNRFSLFGGFDWQQSNTLILGLAGRVSYTSGKNNDEMDLSYLPSTVLMGHANVDVSDTNIGLGAYLMQSLGRKTRVYGNAFLDLHLLNVSRDMTFMSDIDGNGTAFSIISEWGLLHDWLNQYIVGNLYARAGYNFGFTIDEQAEGQDYMRFESDGYTILTPGYSLTAQKRIYPSVWFQIRPYASIGIEYDVLGAPDMIQYKFASANKFTDYNVEIDPLWVNAGAGVELLSVRGYQLGLDYRYQYNADIQMHKVRVAGSYRF